MLFTANGQTKCKVCPKYTSLRRSPLQILARAVVQFTYDFLHVFIRKLRNALLSRKKNSRNKPLVFSLVLAPARLATVA